MDTENKTSNVENNQNQEQDVVDKVDNTTIFQESQPESQIESQTESQPESQVESQSESQVDSQIESQTESQVESQETSDTSVDASRLEKLKSLHEKNQLGGKGSIRRKKVPVSNKKDYRNEFIDRMTELIGQLENVEKVEKDKGVCDEYLSIFYRDFIRRLRKDDRRSNKVDNITEIRKRLSEFLDNGIYNMGIVEYSGKHLNDGTLNNFNKLLKDIHDIIVEKEYEILNKPEITLSDKVIVQSFNCFGVDFSRPTTATLIRSIYKEMKKEEISNKNRPNRIGQLDTSYQTLLQLISSSYN